MDNFANLMTVQDLDRDKLVILKMRYLERLEGEGCLYEVLFDQPEKDDEDGELTKDILDRADELVGDDVVFHEFDGQVFSPSDFDLTLEPTL